MMRLPSNGVSSRCTTEKRKKKSSSKTASTKKNSQKRGMNSVIKGVSKLTLCKTTTSSSGPVDIDDYYYEYGNDDGSHTTETATSSYSQSEPPPSPTPLCQGQSRSVRHSIAGTSSCASLEPLPPPIAQAARRYSETLMRWSEEQQQQFASKPALTNYQQDSSDDESGILYQSGDEKKKTKDKPQQPTTGWDVDAYIGDLDDAFMVGDSDKEEQEFAHHGSSHGSGGNSQQANQKEDDGYEDPPLSAQTNYAREQLLKSSAYRQEHRKKSKTKNKKRQEEQPQQQQYVLEYSYLDEVDESRLLGGYEEGFGVPSMSSAQHEYHYLPHAIREEEDEISVASSVPEVIESSWHNKSSIEESKYIRDDLALAEAVEMELDNRARSSCVHCRNGTCDNQDCSDSRFMI